MRRILFILFILSLIFLGIMFGSINQQLTELNLLIVSMPLRVVDIALIFLLLGIVLGMLIAMLFSLQRKAKGLLKKSTDNA
ncbi:DUF1049 domain-containing protein [Rheinheimera sp. MMS21-TC3]|uniref:DUF1049 domain-containing protein n=1 Tax=Rheinheimera sp. MMS21-TC3 TaxID=3072790 RepID=UPI0028C3D20D|nr:DUF1049 domain-containing protein [Rheinheimera sp. MMS21-TC3]WNO61095.1 DUF1049 domain-containing protein [Rheinheimera sp. MMS21-TC3]